MGHDLESNRKAGEHNSSGEHKDVLQQPRIGFGVIVVRPDGKILLGRRSNESGYGKRALPGGGLDEGDLGSFRIAALRETSEEAGVDLTSYVSKLKIVSVDTSDLLARNWLNFGFLVELDQDIEPTTPTPNEIDQWDWFAPEEIDFDNVYGPSRVSLLCYLQGEILFPFTEDVGVLISE